MTRTVRIHRTFAQDFTRHLDWAADRARPGLVEDLYRALLEVRGRLVDFPEMGMLASEDRSLTVRKLLLRRLPYVVWYGYRSRSRHRGAIGDLWLLRFFGTRQDRPNPDPKSWIIR